MRRYFTAAFVAGAAWLLSMALPVCAAPSATLVILHSFNFADGAYPDGLTLAADGNFYGLTKYGGDVGEGTIFRVTPEGSFTTLYSFPKVGGDERLNWEGANPVGRLVQGKDGNFYGVTKSGGLTGNGTIFRYSLANGFIHLFTFSGVFHYGEGEPTTPFQKSDGTWLVSKGQTIYSFDANESPKPLFTNAADLSSELQLGLDGNYYGLTRFGGINGTGSIFRLTSNGVLERFYSLSPRIGIPISQWSALINSDGAYPINGLLQAPNGTFYGAATTGGLNSTGTLFSITLSGQFHTIHSFTSVDPPDDMLTKLRGRASNVITPSINPEGAHPQSLAFGCDGNLYGITSAGGPNGCGTVFELTPAGKLVMLYVFSAAPNGLDDKAFAWDAPPNRLTQGADGALYGTKSEGGEHGDGMVFKLIISNGTAH